MAMAAKQKGKEHPRYNVELERVLGLTISSNATLSLDPVNGVLAYPAGCVVVLFNPQTNTQKHIFNSSRKTITTVAFSQDGKYIATGEYGNKPAVRVWDVYDQTQIVQFIKHDFEIVCVKFSPNMTHLVSIGSENDRMVNVWNWRSGVKVACSKVVNRIESVAFFKHDPSMFVTVGLRYLKIWCIGRMDSTMNTGTVPLTTKGFQLKNLFEKHFREVATVDKVSYVTTKAGTLFKFDEKYKVEKTAKLMRSNCMCAGKDYVFVGCPNGVVKVLDAQHLTIVTTLPKPHHLGVDVASVENKSQQTTEETISFPDTIAIVLDESHCRLTCVYNDHSMYIWNVKDIHKVKKIWSDLYHSSEVMALEIEPAVFERESLVFPPGSFITSSVDDTIRIWNIDPKMRQNKDFKRNIHSKELLKIIYTDSTFSRLKDINYQPQKVRHDPSHVQVEFLGGLGGHLLGPTLSSSTPDLPKAAVNMSKGTEEETKHGISAISISPDCTHLASGDMNGNVRIYDLRDYKEIYSPKPLKTEIMCLQYSDFKSGSRLLAAGDHRKQIRLYDVENEYNTIQSITDHASRITAIKFTSSVDQRRLLSSSADRSVLFRKMVLQGDRPHFERENHHVMGHNNLYDMDIDSCEREIAMACQDRNVRFYDIATSKQTKCFNGTVGDKHLTRLDLDPSGQYVVTSSADKHLCIVDTDSEKIVAAMYGHSESSAGVKFMKDLRHVVSVSGDSCIFVWRLPVPMTKKMEQRVEKLGRVPVQAVSIYNALMGNDGNSPEFLQDYDQAPSDNDAENGIETPIEIRIETEELMSLSDKGSSDESDELGQEENHLPDKVKSANEQRIEIEEAVKDLKRAVMKCAALYDEAFREKCPENDENGNVLQAAFSEVTEIIKVRSPKEAFVSTLDTPGTHGTPSTDNQEQPPLIPSTDNQEQPPLLPSTDNTNQFMLQQIQSFHDVLFGRIEKVLIERLDRNIEEIVERSVKKATEVKQKIPNKPVSSKTKPPVKRH